jgi:MOSC domain-containing protein YiiM
MPEKSPDPAPSSPQLRDLLQRRSRAGALGWIGVRPARGAALIELPRAQLLTDRGLEGDVSSARAGHARQVSLIQLEHLAVIAALTQRDQVPPGLLRRNLGVRNINLIALRHARFRIGECLLEGSGFCEPCSKMERALGHGGYNAMRGHGGILARVISGGLIRLGDEVDFETPDLARELP